MSDNSNSTKVSVIYNETQRQPILSNINQDILTEVYLLRNKINESRHDSSLSNDTAYTDNQKKLESEIMKVMTLCQSIAEVVTEVKNKLEQYDIEVSDGAVSDIEQESIEELVEQTESKPIIESIEELIEQTESKPIIESIEELIEQTEPESGVEFVKPKRKYKKKISFE
jgi:predicted RND superfamily exporter protein